MKVYTHIISLEPHTNVLYLVMLITGGWNDDNRLARLSTVEMFDPSNPSFSCQLPNMTVARQDHAAVGRTVCGGRGNGEHTCETLDNGQWQVSHNLQQGRQGHVMWQSPRKGVMVIGGGDYGTGKTTERLERNVNGWSLQHWTGYGDITNIVSI